MCACVRACVWWGWGVQVLCTAAPFSGRGRRIRRRCPACLTPLLPLPPLLSPPPLPSPPSSPSSPSSHTHLCAALAYPRGCTGEQRIRSEAAARGVDPSTRIIFSDVVDKALHIARSALADVFLDTPLCNAHTTVRACTVLLHEPGRHTWCGTPYLQLSLTLWQNSTDSFWFWLGVALCHMQLSKPPSHPSSSSNTHLLSPSYKNSQMQLHAPTTYHLPPNAWGRGATFCGPGVPWSPYPSSAWPHALLPLSVLRLAWGPRWW